MLCKEIHHCYNIGFLHLFVNEIYKAFPQPGVIITKFVWHCDDSSQLLPAISSLANVSKICFRMTDKYQGEFQGHKNILIII